jgi:hypothetical protein
MKKVVVFLTILFIAVNANAQFFAGVESNIGNSDNVKNYAILEGVPKLSYFIGANVGYEFLNHFPVSIGVEYGKLCKDYKIYLNAKSLNSFRIPLTMGYCHYIQNFRLFFNTGTFMSIGGKIERERYIDPEPDPSVSYNRHLLLQTYFGYLGQIGIGYKFFETLLISTAFEYNRPFSNELKFKDMNLRHTSSYFYGANIGIKWYF